MLYNLLTIAVVVAVVVWVVGAVVYASWLRHESHKARRDMEQRKTLDRIVHASTPGLWCSSQQGRLGQAEQELHTLKEAPRG